MGTYNPGRRNFRAVCARFAISASLHSIEDPKNPLIKPPEVITLAEAILKLGDTEIRTSDPLTCRTLFRLLGSSVSAAELAELEDGGNDSAQNRRAALI